MTPSEERAAAGERTLSEYDSKALIAAYGVPVASEALAQDVEAAARAAEQRGFPVVLKLCGEVITHKTERDLVRLGNAYQSRTEWHLKRPPAA